MGVGLGVVTVFVLIQAVPYGWSHSNPPVTANAPWPSAQAESLARAACYDCHSNETDWPVYSYVAPMSWLVRRDVEAGRDELNFSEWDRDSDANDAAHEVEDGTMPPWRYTLMHPGARLSDDEKAELIAALDAMHDAR
jgi:cytochrome c551/c552